MQPTQFLHSTSSLPLSLLFASSPQRGFTRACQRRAAEAEEGEGETESERGEGLQTKPDNDVVLDRCYTPKQTCEQQREAGLISEQ